MSIVFQKEFYKLDFDKPYIGVVMMLKNEEKRLQVSLDSIKNYSKALIIYDTGSTDSTIDIIKAFSESEKINTYIISGAFVDFSVSRNVVLEYAEKIDVRYLLLMDCNDELRGGDSLIKLVKQFAHKDTSGFLVCQEWWSGKHDKYYNLRLVKNRHNWRYHGSVHEWLKNENVEEPEVYKCDDSFVLFQDRTKDDDKSFKRFTRDRELLLQDYQKDPKDTRTLFYLAQTCECLHLYEEALKFSELRLELQGFVEERFHSYMRCANCESKLNRPWEKSLVWYLKAFDEFQRAEPLVKIAEYYKNINKWHSAFMYIQQAILLPFPSDSILFIDSGAYNYYRWHLMGIIAYYVGVYKLGKEACLKAIEAKVNVELDTRNLQFYLDKLNEKPPQTKLDRKTFIEKTLTQLKTSFPNLTKKQLHFKVEKLWDEYNKN